MNAVNRVVLVILLLVAMALCTVASVVPVWAFAAIARQAAALVDFFSRLQWYVRVPLGIVLALVLDAIFILLIVLEVRRAPRKSIRVAKVAGGQVQVSVASIADALRYEIDQLPSVLRSRSSVSAKRGGVVVEVDAETVAGVDVPEKAGRIVEAARRVVEDKMGLKLARPPRVNLRAMPYPSAPKAPVREAAGADARVREAPVVEAPPIREIPPVSEVPVQREEEPPALPEEWEE
jgi:hypothetical protein